MTSAINEWFIFDKDTIDRKTCNKIKRWATKRGWEDSSVDTKRNITDEERKSGKKGDY